MYIMALHVFLTIIFLHFVVGNLLLAYDIIHRFTFQTVGNATFSVDSFFFLRWVVCHFSLCSKDYFQSVLHSLTPLMFIYKHYKACLMECKSMSFVTNHIPHLWSLSSSFFRQLHWFLQLQSCFIKAIPIKCFVSHRPTDPFFWKCKKEAST